MLTVPLIAWVAGFGWGCFGIAVAGFAKSIENFSYIVSDEGQQVAAGVAGNCQVGIRREDTRR